MKQTSKILEASVAQNLTDQQLALDQVFIEHSHLRPYFYEGAVLDSDDPNYDEKKAKIEAIAEYHLDFFDSFWGKIAYLSQFQVNTESSEVRSEGRSSSAKIFERKTHTPFGFIADSSPTATIG